MSTINLSLQILPKVPDARTYEVVDLVIKMIEESGIKFMVGPMETTMQGEMDELFDIVKKAHQICLDAGAERVGAMIKTDCKPGGVTMDEKIYKYR
ncbi:MAG: thiamine-binding protein [Candidatus Adiutricales bacterium]|jgi:uncharacterized protein YqgV (UPF0045/DUF77 family)